MHKVLFLSAVLVLVAGCSLFDDGPAAELDERFAEHNSSSTVQVDHSDWQLVLDDYLESDTEYGVNLFDYEGLLDDGRESLDEYVAALEAIDPLTLNEQEQLAYWINLYNSLTVKLIVDNYPLASITKVGSNPLKFGPWDEISTKINGSELSLNDIEHRIIRPKFNDYRIHFAVNCASIGCPSLATEAYLGSSLNAQLDEAANDFLNHARGLQIQDDKLMLSSLFEWYADDFGDDQSSILETLGKHTSSETQAALAAYSGSPDYDYDWGLNGLCSEDDACGG